MSPGEGDTSGAGGEQITGGEGQRGTVGSGQVQAKTAEHQVGRKDGEYR